MLKSMSGMTSSETFTKRAACSSPPAKERTRNVAVAGKTKKRPDSSPGA
jgi:hypothetical protein